MERLFDKLVEYGEKGRIPMHMPGHKRECGIFTVSESQKIDITEIDGFDDYHHPEGVLRDSMEQAAAVYGTKRSFYLVNGSTCGILAAISASVSRGGKILAARNCHKAVGHAIELRDLCPVYIYPKTMEDLWINSVITPESVDKSLRDNPECEAVVLTSPTYEGIISDIGEIARVVHRYDRILIVDEAHGAHLPFGEDFPESALKFGADIVIQSLHKTLPSYTQTAILHVCSNRVDTDRIQKYLGIYQTSSPSYVFMAGMEQCISYMAGEGREKMREYFQNLSELRNRLKGIEGVLLLDYSKEMYAYDPLKIVLFGKNGQTGSRMADILREKFQIEPEMIADNYVILMTSLCDRKEWYDVIVRAAEYIAGDWNGAGRLPAGDEFKKLTAYRARVRMTPREAAESNYEEVELKNSKGRISGQAVYVYPPGIPIVMPGEEITEECLQIIEKHKACGLVVKGLLERCEEVIRCIR